MITKLAGVSESELTPPVPSSVPEPQPVLSGLTQAAIFLVVSALPNAGAERRLLEVAADVNSLVRAVGFRESPVQLTCVVSFGSRFWDRVRPVGAPRPRGLHPFVAIAGTRHDAPSTPGDVLFHIRAERADMTFELARQIMLALGDAVRVDDHVTGFRYFDSRDMLGFVDGTENPTGRSASSAAVIDPDDEPAFGSGSYVIVQKYVHDLDAWGELPTEAQERVIGRTKIDDIELGDDVQPPDSHVSLNTIVDADGTERDILRDNMPFGNAGTGEFGTYYIAYAADVAVTELMLRRMFVGEPPGAYDKILDFSTAVTGSLFFVPSLDLLEELADPTDPADPAAHPAPTPANAPSGPPLADGSLGIGSLRGSRQ